MGLCIFSLCFISSLFIPNFNTFPLYLQGVFFFFMLTTTLWTHGRVSYSPALETTLKSGNPCFIFHSTFGVVLILWPHQTQAGTTTFTKRHSCFHQIPSVLLQEWENCFDLQRGFPVFLTPFVGAHVGAKSLEPLWEMPPFLPVYLFPPRCSL